MLAPQPALKGEKSADLCVVGAGYTGLSAALHAAKAGQSVIVLEAQRIGFGASGRNGGQIGSGFNKDVHWLADHLGRDRAKALWALAGQGKTLVRTLIADHAPDADYRPGIIHAALTQGEVAEHHSEADHLSFNYDYRSLTKLDADQLAMLIGSNVFKGGVLDEGAGYCHPLNLVLGLARAAQAAGVEIHERSEVHKVEPGRVQTNGGVVRAKNILLACNGYGTHLNRKTASHVLPINNYLAVTEPLGDRAPMIRPVAVADSRFVVNYWWQTRDGRLVYGGGESYGRKYPKDIRAKVRANLARVYPELKDVNLTHAWGGTLAVTSTRLPYLAEVEPGLFAAAGYSGHGVALSILCGKLVADAIAGDRSDFDLIANLPTPALPAGRIFGPAMTSAAMFAFSLRDRFGV
nr:FAD-binding oxidoreductase [Pseudaestuariivita rosea]